MTQKITVCVHYTDNNRISPPNKQRTEHTGNQKMFVI